ncbi:MAG: agmatinase [Epulopiscium sp. Nele67-Bin002]|nr:MAG: agmatinase [Epulopiscium sp. Nuni2H_MBin001]OON90353.1 MAG: agmatinase [Epulopiscium sp. Nele67-Bin001]OON90997.1 MAG: agmatinase [Epulopiscium sp. Nele67-Bin002]
MSYTGGYVEHPFHYSGISTFAGFANKRNLDNVDLAIMGIPFDIGTTNRPGARLGPRAVRAVSNLAFRSDYLWTTESFNLKKACPNIIDYGDVGAAVGAKATEFMIRESYKHAKLILNSGASLVSIGGDHTIPYGPIIAASEKYGPLALLHFDSHQDSIPSHGDYSHANFAYDLAHEGCIDPSKSAQVCIRTRMENCGYNIIYANKVIELGPVGLANVIKSIVGNMPVYLTFDIDALDPAYAPGTGTPVCGGPSTNLIKCTLRELEGINIVAADMVEVSPTYDANEITALAAASIMQDIVYLIAKNRIKNN